MKIFLTTLFFLSTLLTNGQKFKQLKEVLPKDTVKSEKAIIYGLFVQRLGFSSGGFPQDIRIINIDTKEIYSLRVKETFKSTKENIFSFHIPPGDYVILNYWWTESKWYGGKTFTESIYKFYASSDIEGKLKSGEITDTDLEKYSLSVGPNTLNYVGTWYFDNELVDFGDDKNNLDEKLKKDYKKLQFDNATSSIPH